MTPATEPSRIARRWRARLAADLALTDEAKRLAVRADELADCFDLSAHALEVGCSRAQVDTALRELLATGWVRQLPDGAIFRIYTRGRRIAAQRPEAFANDKHTAIATA